MICTECGNQIVRGCGPVCLVCQHTGRGNIVLEPKPVQQPEEVQMRGLAAALDATYAALLAQPASEQVEAQIAVLDAQATLRGRISHPTHNRPRPDWAEIDAEERERQEVCQTCLGTRRYLTLPCPDCSEDGDKERD